MLYVTLLNTWAYIDKSASEKKEIYFFKNIGLILHRAIYMAHHVTSRAFA